MTIAPDVAFKAWNIMEFKKFLKIVAEDYEHREEVIREISSSLLDLILWEQHRPTKDKLKRKYRELEARMGL